MTQRSLIERFLIEPFVIKHFVLAVLFSLPFAMPSARADSQPASLFDPSRHMHISEVHPGMKGYGLTVFSGTKIEKFDVVVVNVVKNFNPKYDVVLIRCPQEFLQNTGPIEGMSGSPIFLYDNSGHARMIGAFAYGWPFSKDCLAGVQPIEYMLKLPTSHPIPPNNSTQNSPASSPDTSAENSSPSAAGEISQRPLWSINQLRDRPWEHLPVSQLFSNRPAFAAGAMTMRPLATPLMASGVTAQSLARIVPLFANSGLVPMQAGSAGSMPATDPAPKLEPGSVLAVPLLTGDMELTAVGTCTERIGNRIFGFGHSFNNEGAIELPAGSGSIAAIVANLETSFKLGFMSSTSASLLTDQTVGVAGQVGKFAPVAPIELKVIYDDGSVDQTYHFTAAVHPKLTPMITAAAVMMALTGEKILPEYHTVSYDLTAEFAGGRTIKIHNDSVNGDGTEVIADVALPLMAAADNPFAYVPMSRLTGTFHISGKARAAEILSVMVPQSKYNPGDTVKASISYLPFHSQQVNFPVDFKLPRDLADGSYQLVVSDWTRYLDDEKTANPYKFSADNIDELFSVLKDYDAIPHDAVFLRLVRQADGVAVGHIEMPHLPASRMQVMLDSGRSNITPFVTSTVKIAPTGLVMSGSAEFTIDVEREGKVQTPGAPGLPK